MYEFSLCILEEKLCGVSGSDLVGFWEERLQGLCYIFYRQRLEKGEETET